MSMFQHRHYEATADTLYKTRILKGIDWPTVDHLAVMLKADNPNFNTDKFIERVTNGPR